ncbi:hypothetical protein D3C76_1362330 [compost metagenome]
MVFRGLDEEVGRGFPGAGQFGPDATVAGLQAGGVEAREIAGDGRGEGVPQLFVDAIVDGV